MGRTSKGVYCLRPGVLRTHSIAHAHIDPIRKRAFEVAAPPKVEATAGMMRRPEKIGPEEAIDIQTYSSDSFPAF